MTKDNDQENCSTVLMDERIKELEDLLNSSLSRETIFVERIQELEGILKDVAEQAYKVEVPDAEAHDAKRYRWMRSFAYQAFELVFDDDGSLKYGEELDEAIDSTFVIAAPSPSKEAP